MHDPALPTQRKHWALAVLASLRERPMHPYEIRRLIRERHKEERLVIKAGSLYHAIQWLQRNQFIEPVQKSRDGNRPERTVYRILPAGQEAFGAWLREMLSTPAKEPSSFAVGLDHAVHLQPVEVVDQFEHRARLLETRIQEMDYALNALAPVIGRINLLEVEFERAQHQAELSWLHQVALDIRSGALTWNIEEILAHLRAAAGGRPQPGEPNRARSNPL